MTSEEKFVKAATFIAANTQGTAKDFGIKTVDANALATKNLLKDTGETQRVTNEAGEPTRGRPAKVFTITDEGIEAARKLKVSI